MPKPENPLSAILEAAMREDDPRLDTDWPAETLELRSARPTRLAPFEPRFARPEIPRRP